MYTDIHCIKQVITNKQTQWENLFSNKNKSRYEEFCEGPTFYDKINVINGYKMNEPKLLFCCLTKVLK